MPETMSAILKKIKSFPDLTPKSFAAALQDFDFDGTAQDGEMLAFLKEASACMEASEKSSERKFALLGLSNFANLRSSPHFPNLNVKIVMFQMILRLLKPERVNQGSFGLCGPAHFSIVLIKSKPIKYVSMVWELLAKGKTKGDDGFEIDPDEQVKNFSPQQSIPEADWLLAASMRNAQTPIPVGKERGHYHGTNAAGVFSYFKHAGYKSIILLSCYQTTGEWLAHSALLFNNLRQFEPPDSETIAKNIAPTQNVHNPITNFQIACKLREMGWRVMLSCNENLFKYQPLTARDYEAAKSGKPFDVKRVADRQESRNEMVSQQEITPGFYAQRAGHWVVAKNIWAKGDTVHLNVYTWGEQYTLAADVSLTEFANAYSGFVAAIG